MPIEMMEEFFCRLIDKFKEVSPQSRPCLTFLFSFGSGYLTTWFHWRDLSSSDSLLCSFASGSPNPVPPAKVLRQSYLIISSGNLYWRITSIPSFATVVVRGCIKDDNEALNYGSSRPQVLRQRMRLLLTSLSWR